MGKSIFLVEFESIFTRYFLLIFVDFSRDFASKPRVVFFDKIKAAERIFSGAGRGTSSSTEGTVVSKTAAQLIQKRFCGAILKLLGGAEMKRILSDNNSWILTAP